MNDNLDGVEKAMLGLCVLLALFALWCIASLVGS